jgi:hypothetical protein
LDLDLSPWHLHRPQRAYQLFLEHRGGIQVAQEGGLLPKNQSDKVEEGHFQDQDFYV